MKNKILTLIVIAQFFCTSLWFAGNAVMKNLSDMFSLSETSLGHLTSSVQLGFISGTLFYAILTVSDRFSPSRVFFVSALLGSSCNLLMAVPFHSFFAILTCRYFTGFFLAGIYPVGMKIASDYYRQGLGKALGYLVGALVLGTALPHLIRSFSMDLDWRTVIFSTSFLAILGGGVILFFVGDGPYHAKSQKLNITAFLKVFKDKAFRSPALGYFGHMWELYTFWAFVPVIITLYNEANNTTLYVPLLSFFIIGGGFISCVIGGYLSLGIGSRRTAFFSLLLSSCCCILSLFMLSFPQVIFITFLLIWGLVVIADSPQFSTLVARYAPAEIKGTALTIVNSMGFLITIVSIETVNLLAVYFSLEKVLMVLVLGPVLGLWKLGFKDD